MYLYIYIYMYGSNLRVMGVINQLVTDGAPLQASLSCGLRHSQIWDPLKAPTCICKCVNHFASILSGNLYSSWMVEPWLKMARLRRDIHTSPFVDGQEFRFTICWPRRLHCWNTNQHGKALDRVRNHVQIPWQTNVQSRNKKCWVLECSLSISQHLKRSELTPTCFFFLPQRT